MYLLDTNIFLEILLQQEKAEEAKKLINLHMHLNQLFMMQVLNNHYFRSD